MEVTFETTNINENEANQNAPSIPQVEQNQQPSNDNNQDKAELNIRNASPAILITNLAPNTTEKNLADFFSFCGKITSLTIRKKGNQTVSIIHFETEAAAKTALLLSNAMVNEQAIKVTLYSDEDRELHRIEEENSKSDVRVNFSDIEDTLEISDMPVENITVRNYSGVSDEERTATSVIAGMIAGGYGVGFDVLNKAKQFDEQKHISDKFQAGTDLIKAKVSQIDEQFHISEQASHLGQTITSSWNQFDQNYHITENTSTVINTVNQTVSQSFNTALENPSVQNAVQSISLWGSNFSKNVSAFLQPATSLVSQEFTQIKEESSKKIEERKMRANNNNNLNENEMQELSQDDLPDDLSS